MTYPNLFHLFFNYFCCTFDSTLKLTTMIDNESTNIINFKEMMKSAFAYGSLDKEYSYLKKYYFKLGHVLYNEVYDEYAKYLRNNYMVIQNVHTDHEGCSYNSLKKFTKD